MKTTLPIGTLNSVQNNEKTKIAQILLYIVIFAITTLSNKLFSQENNPGFNTGIETYMSGNGNGAFFSAYVGLDKGRSSLSIGPSVQKRSLKLNTGKISYSYILAGYKKPQKKLSMLERAKANLSEIDSSKLEEEDFADYNPRMQLRFYSYFQYTHNACLRNNIELSAEEPKNANDSHMQPQQWKDMRVSTAELGVGAELQIRITKKLWWKNTVAVSGFQHLNSPMAGCKVVSPISLTIGTGFNIPNL